MVKLTGYELYRLKEVFALAQNRALKKRLKNEIRQKLGLSPMIVKTKKDVDAEIELSKQAAKLFNYDLVKSLYSSQGKALPAGVMMPQIFSSVEPLDEGKIEKFIDDLFG